MRRALGAIVVAGLIGLWNWVVAFSHRPGKIDPARDRATVAVESATAPVIGAAVAELPAYGRTGTRVGPPRQTSPRDALAASSFPADPLAFLSIAPADSLDLLPGIGPVLAGRIIDARRARGGFASWNDVLAIKGVGPATIARWRALAGQ